MTDGRSCSMGSAIVIACVLFLAASPAAWAGKFSVLPISLDLSKDQKTGAFTISNDGDETMNFQITVNEWTQDADGKDLYTGTNDLVYFPRLVKIDPGKSRAIRVGIEIDAPPQEKAYRIRIEELPAAGKKVKGIGIAIRIRFSPPIFIAPAAERRSGSVGSLVFADGTLTGLVRNTGTVRLKLTEIEIIGRDAGGTVIHRETLPAWYLLAGVSRSFETKFPKDRCREIRSVDVNAKSDTIELNGGMHVKPELCPP